MGQQLDTMERQAKQKSQQQTKKRPIATITAKMLEGIRKACKIYRIDIKEVTGEPTASLGKDATTRTPGVLSLFPQIIQDQLRKYADRFEPPTSLPPPRPEDIRIELMPNSKTPRVQGLSRMNETEQSQLKSHLKQMINRDQIQVCFQMASGSFCLSQT